MHFVHIYLFLSLSIYIYMCVCIHIHAHAKQRFTNRGEVWVKSGFRRFEGSKVEGLGNCGSELLQTLHISPSLMTYILAHLQSQNPQRFFTPEIFCPEHAFLDPRTSQHEPETLTKPLDSRPKQPRPQPNPKPPSKALGFADNWCFGCGRLRRLRLQRGMLPRNLLDTIGINH